MGRIAGCPTHAGPIHAIPGSLAAPWLLLQAVTPAVLSLNAVSVHQACKGMAKPVQVRAKTFCIMFFIQNFPIKQYF
jgi:hypothetical protein